MRRTFWLISVLSICMVAGGVWFLRRDRGGDSLANADLLLNLPANRWVEYQRGQQGDWTRQGHSGMTFDTARGVLVIFGSDSHNENWDNTVHEFDPLSRRWQTHGDPSPLQTYRLDAQGRPIAGNDDGLRPWAIHTYDLVEYDRLRGAVIVVSPIDHTPVPRPIGRVADQPAWVYWPAERRWEMHDNRGEPNPKLFGAALTYDTNRDVIIVYGNSLWELGPDRGTWQKVAVPAHHSMHHTAVFDTRRGAMFIFGAYRATCEVWRYQPGPVAGAAGTWSSTKPGSGPCPVLSSAPVAFDGKAGVFLVVANHAASEGSRATAASTYVYDPEQARFMQLPEADLPAIGMNYMLAWDPRFSAFYLVTGRHDTPVTVWALRLDRTRL